MSGWLQALLTTAGVLVVSWGVLIVLARRLPPGLAKDLARFLPDCVTAARRLRRDPRVPRRAKVAVALAAVWVLSPIDLIPEFLPVIGPLDDVVVVALMLRYAGRSVPREVLVQAWPGNPDLLQRLLGPPRDTAGSTPEDDHHPGHHLIPGVPLPAGTRACAADKGGPAGLAL